VLREDARSRRGEYPLRAELVLHPEGEPVQRSAPATALYFTLRFARLGQREVRQDRNAGAQHCVVALDAIEARAHEFDRRHLAVAKQPPVFGGVRQRELIIAGHGGKLRWRSAAILAARPLRRHERRPLPGPYASRTRCGRYNTVHAMPATKGHAAWHGDCCFV